jgi:hypothetical protein
MTKKFWFSFLFLTCAVVAQAWNDTGHETIALIAYDRLTSSEKERVDKILRAHPHYDLLLAAEKPASADGREWVFMRAATWPDKVRVGFGPHQKPAEITKYDHPSWHYVDLPYVWPADKAEFSGKTLSVAGDAAEAFPKIESLLADGSTSQADKAVALCWLIHIIGDIHQPLHTTRLFSHRTPRGDGGGNDLAVSTENEVKNLHAVWDGMLGRTASVEKLEQLAKGIKAEYLGGKSQRRLPELTKHATFQSWIEEGHETAVKSAYLKGKLNFALFKDYADQRFAREAVPTLSAEYQTNGYTLARRQAALAAVRLAREIQKLLATP